MLKIILFILPFSVMAHDYHHHDSAPETPAQYNYEGIASALAADHDFDFGTHSLQGSLGAGKFKANEAFSIGLAKRFKNSFIGDILATGSISTENSETGYGAHVGWRF